MRQSLLLAHCAVHSMALKLKRWVSILIWTLAQRNNFIVVEFQDFFCLILWCYKPKNLMAIKLIKITFLLVISLKSIHLVNSVFSVDENKLFNWWQLGFTWKGLANIHCFHKLKIVQTLLQKRTDFTKSPMFPKYFSTSINLSF